MDEFTDSFCFLLLVLALESQDFGFLIVTSQMVCYDVSSRPRQICQRISEVGGIQGKPCFV
jgi:hypothetical protein